MKDVSEDFEKINVNNVAVTIVNLTRATFKEAAQLKKILDEDIKKKTKKIVVDISECQFIDSTFLGVLVLALKASAKIGGDIRVVRPAEIVKSFMEKAGTLTVFNLYDSLDQAVKSFDFIDEKNYYLSKGTGIFI